MIPRIIFHFPANLFYQAAASENKHFFTRVMRLKIFWKKAQMQIATSLPVTELERSPWKQAVFSWAGGRNSAQHTIRRQ